MTPKISEEKAKPACSDFRVDGGSDPGTPSQRDQESSSSSFSSAPPLAARLVEPPLEALAAYAHEAWSGWMRHLFAKGQTAPNGEDFQIPRAWALRWQRQMHTPYAELSEIEKESDRDEARKMLAIIVPAGRLVDPPSPQPIREQFSALCTKRQKTCPHGWRDRVERCIQCVISEGAAVLAVNRMLAEGVTDASADAYLAVANSQESAARVDPSPLAQLSENTDDQARGQTKADV